MKTNIKTNLLVTVALMALTVTTATAKSWRINNDANMKPDFVNINAAMASDNVQPGDTLYLDAGCTIATDQEITKRVTVIGTGYFRPDAPHALAGLSKILKISADYTKIEGLLLNEEVRVNAQYVVIERCKVYHVNLCSDSYAMYNAREAVIRQCYIVQGIHGWDKSSVCPYYSNFVTIENCILAEGYSYIKDLVSPTIRNNIIYQTWNINGNTGSYNLQNIDNGIIQNNIIINRVDAAMTFKNIANSIVTNNVIFGSTENFPAYAADNLFVDNREGIFTKEGTWEVDTYYQLAENSPAKGYGILGGVAVDCGAFGGPNPYVLNGLPAGFPYYTQASVDARSKNGKVNVSLKIKMQDE